MLNPSIATRVSQHTLKGIGKMTETLTSTLYGLSFLASLTLIGFLWWLAYRFQAARRFCQLLATAWTLNVL